MNRESWLSAVAAEGAKLFTGYSLAPYRVTCGWPSTKAMSRRSRRIGECHPPSLSGDAVHEIFISPLLDDPVDVAGTLMHELAHVAAGLKAGHGPGYVTVARHVGLTNGKPAHVGPGPALEKQLQEIIRGIGAYPHKAMLLPPLRRKRGRSTASLECAKCGCRVTIALKWLTSVGAPKCGCGGAMLPPSESK